jgi:hypothetical protein
MSHNVSSCPTAPRRDDGSMILRIFLLALIASASFALAEDPATRPTTGPTEDDRALAARAEKAIAAAWNTPGHEAANMLAHEWPKAYLAILRGERNVGPHDLAQARTAVRPFLRNVELGPDWPTPARLAIPRAGGGISIDGRLDEPAWAEAWRSSDVYLFNEKEKRESPPTTWRLAWDEQHLYAAFECVDPVIHAPEKQRDEDVYMFDAVELFIRPSEDRLEYWEIVIGAQGALFDALHTKRENGWGPTGGGEKSNVEDMHYGVTRMQDGRGYVVEVAIPWKSLPGWEDRQPKSGDTIRAMLVRIDHDTRQLRPYSVIPLLSWGHNIWNHATLELK